VARQTGWLQQPIRKVLKPLMYRMWDVEITGIENIPPVGPALLAPNHLSFLDSPFTMSLMPRRTLAVGNLDAAASALEAGDLFLIYPEGTRTRDGYLHKGKTGVARLALRTGAPIIPIGLIGTDRIQPPDRTMPKLREKCAIHIGEPIDVSRYRTRVDDRLVLRQITDEVMFEIGELSGQTYVDCYSGDPLPDDLAPIDVRETTEAPDPAPAASA